MSNVIETEFGKATYEITYIRDENNKVVGVTHPLWSFDIVKNQETGKQTAFVCKETSEPFGILESDVFNTVIMSWLLIDDPGLFDSASQ